MFDFPKYFAMFQTTLNQPSNGPMIPMTKRSISYDTSNVIEVHGAYKRYSRTVVFQGLSMTVKKGTIYGLLGASGCGKTTLINCITGLSSLDAGTIVVQCSHRKKMGYMPQEPSLMEKFKVSELLHYFGKVYGMESKEVKKRGKELLQLVNLPPEQFYHVPVTSLSGGQLRRVSLLVALIHNPELLILDEPTVGLDPITRFRLWNFFVREAEEQNKTIIITTHYIEEAKESHKVGLMREGVLLVEASPRQLLSDFKCSSLEDVFLLLSENQAKSPKTDDKPFPKIKRSTDLFAGQTSYFDTQRLAAQIYKNFCWIKRNSGMILYMLLLPGMLCSLFCTVYTNNLRDINVAAVSDESCEDYKVVEPKCSEHSRVSCLYLDHLRNKGYHINEYPDLSLGLAAVKNGHDIAVLYFNPNYTQALMNRIWSSVMYPPRSDVLQRSELQVTMDMTELLKAQHLKRDIQDSYKDFHRGILLDCGFNPRSVDYPIQTPKLVHGSKQIVHSSLPGFIIPFVFYLTTSYTSTAAATEMSSGVLQRSLVSGLTRLEVNLAHAVTQLVIISGQNFIIYFIMYIVYQNPMKGSIGLAYVFLTIAEFQGMLYGFILASVTKKETFILCITAGTILTLFLSSGMFWPIQGMVPILRRIVYFSPWTRAGEAYRSISLRGWDLQHPYVFSALTYNLATVIIFLAINVIFATIIKPC